MKLNRRHSKLLSGQYRSNHINTCIRSFNHTYVHSRSEKLCHEMILAIRDEHITEIYRNRKSNSIDTRADRLPSVLPII